MYHVTTLSTPLYAQQDDKVRMILYNQCSYTALSLDWYHIKEYDEYIKQKPNFTQRVQTHKEGR